MKKIKKILLLSIIILPGIIFAENKTNFQFFKEIDILKPGIYVFNIDNDIESHTKKFLSDLRIFKDNQETKYKILKEKDNYQTQENIVDLDYQKIAKNVYLIDLMNDQKEEYLNKIILDTLNRDFRRVVNVWGADLKEGPYFNLNIEGKRGDLVYDVPGGRNLTINFKYSNYKYLKLKFSGVEGGLNIQSFKKKYKKNILIPGEKESKKLFGDIRENADVQTIVFDLKKENLFYKDLKLLFNDRQFKRKFILYGADTANADIYNPTLERFDKNRNYWFKISEGFLEKDEYSGPVSLNLSSNKRYYRLDIYNNHNEALKFDFAFFKKLKTKVYFKVDKIGKYRVYYSSNRVKNPGYDIYFSSEELKSAQKIELNTENVNLIFEKDKKEWWDNNHWVLYLLIILIILILLFFVYKILMEAQTKTKKDEIKF